MEKDGLQINEQECQIESAKSLNIMIKNATEITELTNREFTNSNDCLYDILINQFGLPVLATIKEREEGQIIDTGRPSFDKNAMALYKVHPAVTSDEKINKLVNLIAEYRTEQQFKSLYLDTFLELNENGIIHPNYNQTVRTGRLSCSKPNSQQQNSRSKALIHPPKDYGFISNDYSQIEYRLIVHYAKIERAIKAYLENPNTDYHQWVAELLMLKRKRAKAQNFGMAYGMGKKTVVQRLTSDEDIIKTIGQQVNQLIEENKLDPKFRVEKFNELCKEHAESAYEEYHEKMPEIRKTSRQATKVAAIRGFIFNSHGRRRYLPGAASYKAFNSIIQSDAADIMKERLVAISPRYNSESQNWEVKPTANVHDETLNKVPLEELYNPNLHKFICDTLENTNVKYRVPILTGLGVSPNNWAEAAGDEVIKNEKDEFIAGKIR